MIDQNMIAATGSAATTAAQEAAAGVAGTGAAEAEATAAAAAAAATEAATAEAAAVAAVAAAAAEVAAAAAEAEEPVDLKLPSLLEALLTLVRVYANSPSNGRPYGAINPLAIGRTQSD